MVRLKTIFKFWRRLSVLIVLLFYLSGCSNQSNGGGTIRVWVHAGTQDERQIITKQVQQFNASQDEIKVEFTFIPEGSYNAQIQAASLSGDLPDVLEFDGPFVYNYVWQRKLIPIDNLLSQEVQQELLPSLIQQGIYKQERLYSVGTFDSGLGMYGYRSQLQAAGVRIPTSYEDAWTSQEFNQILAALAEKDPKDRQVLDLKLNYRGEWFTYAFSPIIQSAGGDLINRSDYTSAEGILNNERAVAVMEQLQSWLEQGYVDPNTDDSAFTEKRVALSWGGHWNYQNYLEAAGDDLVVLPLPNFGKNSKTGQGSWNWGITTNCKNPQAAMRFLEFLLQTEQVLAMSNANGAVPATQSAIARSKLYGEGAPLQLFSSQLSAGQSVPRPQTPAYPVITSAFQQAFADIRSGLDVKTALNKAVITIDQDIEDNEGYRDPNPEEIRCQQSLFQFMNCLLMTNKT
ncbi:MAG: sugar ABC transporter substrate-binding protein [Symploca sp. SIO2B6]|nr:sugar ABC transporter substrate-binding protein [Symploca sp. SIO2B6]